MQKFFINDKAWHYHKYDSLFSSYFLFCAKRIMIVFFSFTKELYSFQVTFKLNTFLSQELSVFLF